MSKEPRYYQIEAKDAVMNSLKKGIKNCMLVMATGTGKTFTACTIAKEFKKVLWLTHSEELIEQSAVALLLSEYKGDINQLNTTMRTFKGFLAFLDAIQEMIKNPLLISDQNLMNIDYKQVYDIIGVIKRERMDLQCKITVASIQTIHRRLDKIDPNHFDIIVVDECHMAAAATWEKSINHFNYVLNLGLTATPHRADGMSLGNIYDKIVYEYSILQGINDGFLVELNAIAIKTHINLDSVRTTAGELNQKDLAIVNNPARNKLIVEKYIEYASGRPFFAYCVDVAHAIALSQAFNDAGINTTYVVGDVKICPDRPDRIRKFKRNEYQGLTNCMVLTTGVDIPAVSCIIMACPTKSLTKFLQCLGRATRTLAGVIDEFMGRDQADWRIAAIKESLKEDSIILDCVDVTSKHRLINTISLDADADIENKIFLKRSEKQLKIKMRDAARKTKLESERKRDERIDLFKIPKVKVIDSPRMKEEATEKQLAWIARLGYDVVNIKYTKGMCSEIISAQGASDNQKYALKKAGYAVPEDLTLAEAQAAFAEIDERNGKAPAWKQKATKPFSDM